MAKVIFTGGYVDDNIQPLYEFGYGQSFTTFKISNLKIINNPIKLGDEIKFSIDIENIGNFPGSDVVQVYYHFDNAHVILPNKQLIAYKKVYLEQKAKKRIKFAISTCQLGYLNEKMDFVIESGQGTLYIGDSSENIFAKTVLLLEGNTIYLKGKRKYFNTPIIKEV
ncbi:fibronectin type III-like domain-contianing protein [Liquorilactobacillus vini]|uniref:fibronectin type III-like domain-contianing protein n=1 Tax=Liquorilactobacillus vini TaxID=238015 RepID=UPI001F2C7393|nr:fibronectin type III-like domain-contianing protein [Liquorilactobacillus vini]